eukprot:gene8874-823_t
MNPLLEQNTTISDLQDLSGIEAYDAETLEVEVMEKVTKEMEEKDEIIKREISKIDKKIQEIHDYLGNHENNKITPSIIRKKEEKLGELELEKKKIVQNYLNFEKSLQTEETEEERLIRTGMITPFENTNKKRKRKETISKKKKKQQQKDDDDELVSFNDDFSIPSKIYDKLFDYQKTGVRWLFELHSQSIGGIIGDEMGLGKTVQIISFLSGLIESNNYEISIIVCPATVLNQWKEEIEEWCPKLQPIIFHSSSSDQFNGTIDELLDYVFNLKNGIMITTYDSIRIHQEKLIQRDFYYVILDEGHKIRNPDAEITIACKRFPTPHRLILTGTPISNNLKELWCLFDFIFPGKLGTLKTFQCVFGIPISQGGYVNATTFHVQTAYKCSVTLRDLISPYLLRRIKKDVNHNLPKKTEQILFCKLSKLQVSIYKEYLKSKEIKYCLENNGNNDEFQGKDITFKVISNLRKICNHPNLFRNNSEEEMKLKLSSIEDCGKLSLVSKLLPLWKEKDHRVLLYSQSVKMLDLFEDLMKLKKFKYLRMDGKTDISSRQNMIDKFNKDESYFIFLLTTKVLKDPRQRRFFKENDLNDLFQLGSEYLENKNQIGTETGNIFGKGEIVSMIDKNEDENIIDNNEEYRIENMNEELNNDKNEQDQGDETFILKCLLDGKEIQSAFNHDVIMSSSCEKSIAQIQAENVAKNAKQILKKSFNQPLNEEDEIIKSSNKFGKQKSSIILNQPFYTSNKSFDLKENQRIEINSKNILNKMKGKELNEEKDNLMNEIFNYLKLKRNGVSTTEIVRDFKNQTKGEKAILFKSMLKEIKN